MTRSNNTYQAASRRQRLHQDKHEAARGGGGRESQDVVIFLEKFNGPGDGVALYFGGCRVLVCLE
eukprot:scaffold1321_cov154-Skeletonema_menzelii.AAC.18